MTSLRLYITCLIVLLAGIIAHADAFGAGNVKSLAAIEGEAFRHGDLEDALKDVRRRPKKHWWNFSEYFDDLDLKRVYFGNWLRDYSQAVDVATLSLGLPRDVLKAVVALLSFQSHGFATVEFEVNRQRLGVYRPDEHIDNPKGYASNAQMYDKDLRGPVDPRELEIDSRTGMKNFIANESGGWPTSSAYIRTVIHQSVFEYRRGNETEGLLHLGRALHTLEDWSAHTNFVELALQELGYRHMFTFTGELTAVRYEFVTDNSGIWDTIKGWLPWTTKTGCYRPIYPLVTGTFAGLDFAHSLLGELTDKAGELPISKLLSDMRLAKRDSSGALKFLISMLRKLTNIDEVIDEIIDDIQKTIAEISKPVSGPVQGEAVSRVWKVLELRDRIIKRLDAVIDKIPGYKFIKESISNAITRFIYSIIEPYATPVVAEAIYSLQRISNIVISTQKQREVFMFSNITDPTHSVLSKDHFDHHLNEPAGLIGKAIVNHVGEAVVTAWHANDQASMDYAIKTALDVFHHPAESLTPKKSAVQKEMLSIVRKWADKHPEAIAAMDKRGFMDNWHKRVKSFKLDCAKAVNDIQKGQGYGWICGVDKKKPPTLPPTTVPSNDDHARCRIIPPVKPTTTTTTTTTTTMMATTSTIFATPVVTLTREPELPHQPLITGRPKLLQAVEKIPTPVSHITPTPTPTLGSRPSSRCERRFNRVLTGRAGRT
ncbi:hypothetical protein HDU85_000379 [Gaertneriomyces sp. JEL0708]|nr:hypothetical protein HDU85_000379 [Gaertneriomyces sp. JEL0708]